ncbi:MAG: hypothetical protein WBA05_17930 [Gordonia sp. (in: high G+C Gram-positive bacteria)]|uniref:hypothetical protein n=1 Tax=Gordonia sp. (in: high G+C Gram-positive bacteria) TaxID=84139 RepID=UPI003C70ECE4
MISPNRAVDELVYATRRLVGAVEWLDEVASDHGHADGCCSEPLDAVSSIKLDMPRLLSQFTHFSDGRPMVSYVAVDDGHMRMSNLWPPDPADMPTGPVDTPPYALAPDREHGDRGHVIVTWDPATFTGSARYVAPPDPRRGLRVV